MKLLILIAGFVCISVSAFSQEKNVLLDYLTLNKPVKAEIITVETDPGMAIYGNLIKKAKEKDPEWFAKHQTEAPAGMPLPYHEKLMSKEDYEGYLETWAKRKIVPKKGQNGKPIWLDVILMEEDGLYSIFVQDTPISLLEYDAKKNEFDSSEGKLTFLEDIKAPKESALGVWSGTEWKFKEEKKLYTTKLNFAIGRMKDKYIEYGLLIYRYQRIDSKNQYLANESIVLRFAPVKKEKK